MSKNDVKSFKAAVRRSFTCMSNENEPKLKIYPEITIAQLFENFNDQIPKPLVDLANFIREKCLLNEGVFRKTGSAKETEKFYKAICKNKSYDFKKIVDANVATSLFKQIIRDIDTIVPENNFDELISILSEKDEQVQIARTRILLKCLPSKNQELIKFIIELLVEIVKHSHINKMNSQNLGSTFGPTLFKRLALRDITSDQKNTLHANALTKFFIEKYAELFS